ncbi:FtsK/SpoIIIE domain-containing protein [Nocardia farcinica]|uniref:Stage III sporulation protein E n=2 Tax=Nocardia farcinica TaxID=37329 RepID=A0A0H5NQA0_NOCFR|nr:FtsK/SpoIIIE domain-containing protein [Nocardia farcinica]CRY77583.1 Stage III sporulation protein E [Nocardia farcinica]
MSTVATIAAAGGALAGAGWLAWMRHLGTGPRPVSVDDIVAAAPPELRPAALILGDRAQTNLMFSALGLGSVEGGFPFVDRWDYADHGVDVDVMILGGQSFSDWSNDRTLAQFATYFSVPEVTVSSPAPSWVRLHLRVFDTLEAPAPAPGVVHHGVDLEAVPVGVTEAHDVWRLRVLYGHILVAGATGSGKGSVLWSILAGVGPAIRDGLVDVYLADPKGGVEFGRGENRLFVRFATDVDSILEMLRELVEVMRERRAFMRANGIRKHRPTTEQPLILIIIDEAAALSAYAEPDQVKEFRRLTGLILSQGRAVAVSMVAALQDPSKETMPNRQLFPIRIGLRLDEPTQVAMVHGQGARDRGARCDKISERTPGVGYVGEDGTAEFVRVRAFWVSDEAADAIVDAYSPAPEITGPTEDYSEFDPDYIPGEDGAAAA